MPVLFLQRALSNNRHSLLILKQSEHGDLQDQRNLQRWVVRSLRSWTIHVCTVSFLESLSKGNKGVRERQGGGVMKVEMRMIKEHEKLLKAEETKEKILPYTLQKEDSPTEPYQVPTPSIIKSLMRVVQGTTILYHHQETGYTPLSHFSLAERTWLISNPSLIYFSSFFQKDSSIGLECCLGVTIALMKHHD